MIQDRLKTAGLVFAALLVLLGDILGILSIEKVFPVPLTLVDPIKTTSTILCTISLLVIVYMGSRPVRKDRMRTIALALALCTGGFAALTLHNIFLDDMIVEGIGCQPEENRYFLVPQPLSGELKREVDKAMVDGDFGFQKDTHFLAVVICDGAIGQTWQTMAANETRLEGFYFIMLCAAGKSLIFSGIFLLLWSLIALERPHAKKPSGN